MRLHKLVILVMFIGVPLIAFVKTVHSASTTASLVVPADALITQGGSNNGLLQAITALDQSGNADAPANYIAFTTPNRVYYGYLVFHLPAGVNSNLITSSLLQVNVKAPSNTAQKWTWSLYDWNSQMWIKVGDTVGSRAGEWTTLTFRINNLSRYISTSREMRVQLKSDNASEDIKVDYEAIHITYIPIVPTSTRGIPTSAPTKGVFVLPTTLTPSPTNTPTNTPTATNTPTPTNTPVCATYNLTFESQVLTLLNQQRTSRGIPALTMNDKLRNAARGHSQDMACNNFMSHVGSDGSSPGDRLTAAGYDFSTWGENVAAGYTSPSSVVNAWMDSSGHRANILDADFTEIGIGYVYNSASTYDHYWTTDFGAP